MTIRMVRVAFAAALTNLLLVSLASAATLYVRPGATGANDGSDWNNAYSSLPSTLVRGNTYYLADGTYGGRNFSTAASGGVPITIRKATVTDHGTSSGWQAAYGDGQAVFNSGLSFSSSDWVFDGATGGGAANKWNGTPFGFKLAITSGPMVQVGNSGTRNVTLKHLEFAGGGPSAGGANDGVVIRGASNVTVSHFLMREIGKSPFWIGAINTVVEHGWVQSYYSSAEAHAEVASIWDIGNGAFGDATFRHNLFTHIVGTGGLIWDNSSNTNAKLYVYGNVFYKPDGASWDRANGLIGGWTGGNGEEFRNAIVYNNTFVNVDQQSLSTFPNVYSGNVAYNNVFYNSQSPDFSRFGTHNYNHFINSGGTHSEPNGTSAASGDPFVSITGRDFRLKAGTPAGIQLQAPFNVDPLAKARGSDGTFDRGAYEFNGDAAALPAPSNLRVVQ